jgi:hypothetical protein
MDFPPLGQAILRALALDAQIFVAAQEARQGLWSALIVVGLAGLSQALGQSLVLFINQVRPRRFILAVLASTIGHVGGYGLWLVSVWLVGVYAFGVELSWAAVAAAVGLAYAPQLLAFFELTPFLGSPFGVLLSLWTLLAIVTAVRAGFGLETWQAVVTSGLGWLMLQAWHRTLGAPVNALGRWVEQRAAGVPLRYGAGDVPQLRRRPKWIQNMTHWRRRRAAAGEAAGVEAGATASSMEPQKLGRSMGEK